MRLEVLVACVAMCAGVACGGESEPIDAWDGFDERLDAQCECFDALGFSSKAECITTLDTPMVARDCVNDVYNSDSEWKEVAACNLAAEQQRAGCEQGLACDDLAARQACRDEFDIVSAECPASPPDLDDAITACL